MRRLAAQVRLGAGVPRSGSSNSCLRILGQQPARTIVVGLHVKAAVVCSDDSQANIGARGIRWVSADVSALKELREVETERANSVRSVGSRPAPGEVQVQRGLGKAHDSMMVAMVVITQSPIPNV
jgi:hypothetical protein